MSQTRSTGRPRTRREDQVLEVIRSGALDRARNRTDVRGRSLLAAAILAGSESIALELLERGANSRWGGPGNTSPLELAAAAGMVRIVSALVERGARSDAALGEAAASGWPEAVDVLLATGADPVVGVAGRTALQRAAGPYRREILRRLRAAAPAHHRRRALAVSGAIPRGALSDERGVSEFLDEVAKGDATWQILAFAYPITELSPRLAESYGVSRLERDVAERSVEEASDGRFLLQLRDRPWTLELRAIGWTWRGGNDRDDELAQVSRELGCDLVLFAGSDTSGTLGLARYAGGSLRERSEWTADGRLITADGPEAQHATFGVDHVCRQLRLFVPACKVTFDGLCPQLTLRGVGPDAVARLDYLVVSE